MYCSDADDVAEDEVAVAFDPVVLETVLIGEIVSVGAADASDVLSAQRRLKIKPWSSR